MSLPLELRVEPDAEHLNLCRGELLCASYLNRSLEVVLLPYGSKIDKLIFIRCEFYPIPASLV